MAAWLDKLAAKIGTAQPAPTPSAQLAAQLPGQLSAAALQNLPWQPGYGGGIAQRSAAPRTYDAVHRAVGERLALVAGVQYCPPQPPAGVHRGPRELKVDQLTVAMTENAVRHVATVGLPSQPAGPGPESLGLYDTAAMATWRTHGGPGLFPDRPDLQVHAGRHGLREVARVLKAQEHLPETAWAAHDTESMLHGLEFPKTPGFPEAPGPPPPMTPRPQSAQDQQDAANPFGDPPPLVSRPNPFAPSPAGAPPAPSPRTHQGPSF